MKLLRVGLPGKEKPAIIDNEKNFRDLSKVVSDFNPQNLNFDTIEKINQKNINVSLPMSDKSGETIVENLLRPTKIYVKLILELLKNSDGIKAISNITGGGITENLPRIFPNSNIGARINLSSWKRPSIFSWLQELGNIDEQEILKTLNCGIGMILIANRNSGEEIFEILEKKNEAFYIIGEIIETDSDNSKIIFHRD